MTPEDIRTELDRDQADWQSGLHRIYLALGLNPYHKPGCSRQLMQLGLTPLQTVRCLLVLAQDCLDEGPPIDAERLIRVLASGKAGEANPDDFSF